MQYGRPEGTFDILPPIPAGRNEQRPFVNDIRHWLSVENTFRMVCKRYGFTEIRSPIFESTALFHRAVGDGTDIVSKETYDLVTRGGDKLTLRPEGTAGAIRAYVSDRMWNARPVAKLLYLGPNFRYERSQRGRYRQHHQAGVEVLGSDDPSVDAEVIDLACAFYGELGITNLTVKVNSVGNVACRSAYLDALKGYAEPLLQHMSADNNRRFNENPLRMLDSKVVSDIEIMSGAPKLVDYLDADSASHFTQVLAYLDLLNIPYEIDHRLVRGFDYYTKTAFEIQTPILGDKALGGGGRYNQLVEVLGGPHTPGIGFGLGIERILITLEELGLNPSVQSTIDAYLCPMGADARACCVPLLKKLRSAGLAVDMDYLGRRLKTMFEHADGAGATYAIIVGETEVEAQTVTVRRMDNAQQQSVPMTELIQFLQSTE